MLLSKNFDELISQYWFVLLFKFTFPYTQYCPPARNKYSGYLFIMSNVPFPLLLPVVFIIFGTCIPAIVAVPETPVYKYCYLSIEKNKIRMALYMIIPTPASNSIFLKDLNKPYFRGFIPLGFDLSHYFRAVFFVEYVAQRPSPFKLNTQAGVGFRKDNFIIFVHDVRNRGIAISLIKQAMFINVRG